MTTLVHKLRKCSIVTSVALMLAFLGQTNAWSVPLNLPDSPLFALNTVEPNVILTLDDSGSMAWGFLPDSISGYTGTRRFCSSTYNLMYYDPAIVYSPGVDQTGTALANANFTAARVNPYNNADASVVNLSGIGAGTYYRPVYYVAGSNTTVPFNAAYASCNTAPLNTPQAAFYYVYTPSLAGTVGCPNPAVTTDDDCYVRVTVSATSGTGPVGPDERVNFANWYTYYRVRMLATKSASGRAFSQIGENIRLGYQRINTCNSGLGIPASTACPGNFSRRFSGAARTDFFTWLLNSPMSGGTPLVQAASQINQYVRQTGVYSPWAEVPGTPGTGGVEHSCRQNFSIIMTDGIWNGAPIGGNVDGSTLTLPDGTAYSSAALPANRRIYPDTNTGFLADVVFDGWRTDARTLTNNVPAYAADTTGIANMADPTTWDPEAYFNPVNDPARWQHISTFTMGLGLNGLRNFPADYNGLLNGTLNWNGGNHVDDLWHAAVNGRGQYFSARNPQQLVEGFTTTLNQIQARIGSGAGLSANGGSSGSDTYLYQVKFNTSNWTGKVLALALDPSTGSPVTTPPAWDSSVKLNSQNWDTDRNIFTFKPSINDGVRFRWPDLDPAQQNALDRNSSNNPDGNGAARLDYLRGDSTNEGGTPPLDFRVRSCTDINDAAIVCPANGGKLGDIVDSSAVYVGKPPYNYPATLESSPYRTFADANASRTPMVYAGANDGMLHGFNASYPVNANSGREEMAYVPNLVYSNLSTNNLSLLTSPSYTHRYYVNGTPTVGDAFFAGSWHTVLVGGLRKGGKGYYALDITNPSNFNEGTANASNLALWEFTDPDLGYTFSQATIIKVASNTGTGTPRGRWAAIFGNGYNNTGTGHSVVYVVDIETGTLIAKLDTAVSGGGGDVNTPNGMATPAVVDINRDHIADYIYAGDLRGKMWRFDIRSSTSTDWALAANISPIFTATDANNAIQPITERPAIGFHPLGYGGLMVYFGTGKYLESSDNTTSGIVPTQSFYGIYDRGVTAYSGTASAAVSIVRSDLLQQTFTAGTAPIGGYDIRLVSDTAINWRLTQTATAGTHLGWYVNLPTNGEKQVTDPLLREGRIIFSTLIPPTNPCEVGGSGWLMELNANNGGRLDDTFDLNEDGVFTSLGDEQGGIAAAGAKPTSGSGALSTPIVLSNPSSSRPPVAGSAGCKETKYSQGTNGSILKLAETCTPFDVRQAWRQRK